MRRLDDRRGLMDLFWPGVLLLEQKSAGRSPEAAAEQADAYFDALPARDRPRLVVYRLLFDSRTFDLHDRDPRERVSFRLPDLPQHIEKFRFMLGVETRSSPSFEVSVQVRSGSRSADPPPTGRRGAARHDRGRPEACRPRTWTARSRSAGGASSETVSQAAAGGSADADPAMEQPRLPRLPFVAVEDRERPRFGAAPP